MTEPQPVTLPVAREVTKPPTTVIVDHYGHEVEVLTPRPDPVGRVQIDREANGAYYHISRIVDRPNREDEGTHEELTCDRVAIYSLPEDNKEVAAAFAALYTELS